MSRVQGVPHPFPYQGSKRQLAREIVSCIPANTKRLVEPFVGSGAVTLASAWLHKAERYLLNDAHKPVVELWKAIIDDPEGLAQSYERLWADQHGRERVYYDQVRESFNRTDEPHYFLYLLARCVKAAVRYNRDGEFNNSPDNRRRGMRPDTMRLNLELASELLRGRVKVLCEDYKVVLRSLTSDDVVYMDPPYQGVCDKHNHRYVSGVDFHEFAASLAMLNEAGVPFIVSYDGRTGDKTHGHLLPKSLKLHRFEIKVGRSTQATLLGRNEVTIESLYLSPSLLQRLGKTPSAVRKDPDLPLFAVR
jgi:DNA adenine methylase